MIELQSYVCGKWVGGQGKTVLINPATEEDIARAGSEAVDFSAALAHARASGAALRALSFRERGALLLGFSRAIHAHRDALLEPANTQHAALHLHHVGGRWRRGTIVTGLHHRVLY